MTEDDPIREYKRQTPASEQHHRAASSYLPGGDSRAATFHKPYPSFASHGSGCTVTTVDDKKLLDFHNNYTQTVLGHAPSTVVESIVGRLRAGNGFGMPTDEITELAHRLVERIPSVEFIRFCNSGTEATMNAIRLAMAQTGNYEVLKVLGGYHGSHDTVEAEVNELGRSHRGIPPDVEGRVWSVPYNDVEALKAGINDHGENLACFIIEPIMGAGGMIPATETYLETARDLADKEGFPLIFDETISYRLDVGGAQSRYGVKPDLTALGKVIGGGLPIGAFGGRRNLMNLTHPETGQISHTGTFNANPATMAGGIATLERLDSRAIEDINKLGDDLRKRLNDLKTTFPFCVSGDGSLFQIHLTDEKVVDKTTSTAGEPEIRDLYFRLRNEGIFLAPRGTGSVSTPMGTKEIIKFVDAFKRATADFEI